MPFTRAAPWLAGMGRIAPGADLLAGLTLWGVLVPEALAYAGMAGMPASAGLFTLLASLPLYFLCGGSPVLVCAATSVESIMMAAVVAPLAEGMRQDTWGLWPCLSQRPGSSFSPVACCAWGAPRPFSPSP